MSMQTFGDPSEELAKRSLLSFAQRMEPAFTSPAHITLLVDLLEKLERGDIQRLCISLPPRFGKTTLCSQLFPAWCIGRDARRSVILANHSSELANGFSRKAKNYVESSLWPFPKITMSEDSRATHRWNVSPGGGGLYSVGVNSGLTGVGMDIGIVDDPVNDALSQVERDQAWSWFKEVFFPRQNADARLLVVSARLAVDDVVGHLMESEDAHLWRFVSLPAVNAYGNELGLPEGEPLWDRFDLKALAERRTAMGLGPYESQYQQNPSVSAGGRIFSLSDFPTYEILPQPKALSTEAELMSRILGPDQDISRYSRPVDRFFKVTGADFAGIDNTSSGGSYHAMVSLLFDANTGDIYITDAERCRNVTRQELMAFATRHLERNAPSLVVVEEAAAGGFVSGFLTRTRWPVRLVQPKVSKEARAMQALPLVEAHKVHLPQRAVFGDMLRQEIAEFPSRYTDLCDSMIWAILYCRHLEMAQREDDHWDRTLNGFSLFR
jgi:phage terminase large subunit-like protein